MLYYAYSSSKVSIAHPRAHAHQMHARIFVEGRITSLLCLAKKFFGVCLIHMAIFERHIFPTQQYQRTVTHTAQNLHNRKVFILEIQEAFSVWTEVYSNCEYIETLN